MQLSDYNFVSVVFEKSASNLRHELILISTVKFMLRLYRSNNKVLHCLSGILTLDSVGFHMNQPYIYAVYLY